MSYSALTTMKTIVNHFSTLTDTYMKDEDKVKSIRLNINFIASHPDLFDNAMTGPTDMFYGHSVTAKTLRLETVYDLGEVSDSDKEDIKNFNPSRVFDEIASFWRMRKAQGHTIIPYVPIEAMVFTSPDSFSAKMGFRTRFGEIKAVR